MFGLMNIIIVSAYKTITLQVLYYFKNILKFLFTIHISSTWFHMSLILHPIHSGIKQFSHMKLSYLLLERILVLIYCMMKILQPLLSLIQSQIYQPVINFQHRLKHVWTIALNGEEPIRDQGALDEPNYHQTPRGKSKVKISICIRNS